MPDTNFSFLANPGASGGGLQTLGNIMNIAGGAQQLQRGGIELQKARETLPAEIAGTKARSQQEITAANLANWRMNAEQAGKGYEIAGGLVTDPRINSGDSKQAVTALMEAEDRMRTMKIPEDMIRVQLAPLYGAASRDPASLNQMLKNIVIQGINSSGQVGAVQPSYLGTGGTFKQVSPFAAPPAGGAPTGAGGAPSSIPATIPPSGLQAQGQDALGRPVIQAKDPNTGALSFQAPPGTNYKPLMQLPPGETPQTAAPLLALRDNAQAAAATVPSQHFNNRQILSLAPEAFTGAGSPELSKILGSVGLQKVSGDAAAKTAQLQHFISLQIQSNAAAQGANTDAARAMAEQAVLPGSSPEQAIKAITKVNDAYATGTEMFNKGIQATLNNPNNQKDVFAIRDFQNAWTANMDPRIFQLENAVKDADKGEINRLKKSLGPSGMKELLTKARNLQALISRGAVGGP